MKEGVDPRMMRILTGYSLWLFVGIGVWFAWEGWAWAALVAGVILGAFLTLFNYFMRVPA